MSRTPQVTSLLSSWFWLAYLAIPAYGLYKLLVMVRFISSLLLLVWLAYLAIPAYGLYKLLVMVRLFLFPPAFGLVSLPHHTSLRSVQWLQWLQLGVTFSQVVWLIGC